MKILNLKYLINKYIEKDKEYVIPTSILFVILFGCIITLLLLWR